MILVTGGSGQLGRCLQALATERKLAFTAVSRPEFEFEHPETVKACFEAAKPGIVINAAAYTAVDAAELHIHAARACNHTGPLQLAELCAAAGVPLIHVSTDYVFDGTKGAPYVETDRPRPTGVYGNTKLQGETAILASNAKAIILRTSWVYAPHGKNFARTMLSAGRKLPGLKVVADQRGAPTAAPDLARAILDIVARLQETGWQDAYRGVYHATGMGETTWHGFAEAIFAEAAACGEKKPDLCAITTAEWPTAARRPPDSRLDCTKLSRIFGIEMPDWRESLGPIVRELLASGAAE